MIAGHCWHTVNRADKVGEELREQLRAVQKSHPKLIKEVRGRGLLNAVVLHQAGLGKASAYDVCIGLKNRGILAKPTHGNIIRLSPPLTIKYSSDLSVNFQKLFLWLLHVP